MDNLERSKRLRDMALKCAKPQGQQGDVMTPEVYAEIETQIVAARVALETARRLLPRGPREVKVAWNLADARNTLDDAWRLLEAIELSDAPSGATT